MLKIDCMMLLLLLWAFNLNCVPKPIGEILNYKTFKQNIGRKISTI